MDDYAIYYNSKKNHKFIFKDYNPFKIY